jgi:hypothetical protein
MKVGFVEGQRNWYECEADTMDNSTSDVACSWLSEKVGEGERVRKLAVATILSGTYHNRDFGTELRAGDFELFFIFKK